MIANRWFFSAGVSVILTAAIGLGTTWGSITAAAKIDQGTFVVNTLIGVFALVAGVVLLGLSLPQRTG